MSNSKFVSHLNPQMEDDVLTLKSCLLMVSDYAKFIDDTSLGYSL